jgi:TPR repeat protein
MQWYQKAASLGNDDAEYDIGILYANGWGVQSDMNQAKSWIKKAADAGNDNAKKWLNTHVGAY